ncbi:hypothetical protein [Aurantiacibacter gilvus]|uniref:Uncharacterized protein n=1 Tax=Aurantiacibacter gilvus TaxID=3139141 RepID=A0ABU9IBU4_9SPHN
MRTGLIAIIAAATLSTTATAQDWDAISMPRPAPEEWAAIAELPDLSGTWSPDIRDQFAQMDTNPPNWLPHVQEQVDYLYAEEEAGRPKGLFIDCLPHGSPSLMAVTHNAIEFLVTPGRVTVLGESDGNRIRRIWTDGRDMPEDPDPSFDGYSVGYWNDGVLVVETAAILPQVYLAISEAVGIPNNGGMTVSERIHLLEPDLLAVDMVIDAPEILAEPYETRRLFHRRRQRSHEIEQGVCRRGDFIETEDEWGNAAWAPATHDGMGNLLPDDLLELLGDEE